MEIYKGIRYARAERFALPVQEPALSNLKDLDMQMKICPQNPSRLDRHIGLETYEEDFEQSEDCLLLSVYTPSTTSKLPVLVWIHGGAFVTGSAFSSKYDSTQLAEFGNMVVVNISYRLGAFGFLYVPQDNVVNLGLADQVCALRWIKENIHLFGGDPDNVTIFGQSAGGTSVIHHIAEVQEPLFQKAIVASSPFLPSSRHHAQKITRRFFANLGVDPRYCSVELLLHAQAETVRRSKPGMPFSPVGASQKEPLKVVPGLKSVLLWCQQDDAYPFVPIKLITRPATKLIFKHPIFKYAKHMESLGIDTTCKVLEWRHGDSVYGAEHCMELPLLFGDWNYWKDSPFMDGVTLEEYQEESVMLKTLVADFVKK